MLSGSGPLFGSSRVRVQTQDGMPEYTVGEVPLHLDVCGAWRMYRCQFESDGRTSFSDSRWDGRCIDGLLGIRVEDE